MGILRSGNPAPLLSQNCIFGLSASQQNGRYSITSSARARSVGGISNTSALAVLRLIAKYKVVGDICDVAARRRACPMSALSPKADVGLALWDVS